jgi:uncharacterized membrane protein HdeD (DUF308 family)
MAVRKPTLRQRFQALPWWAVPVAGVAAILLGILLMIAPKNTVTSIMWIAGWLGIVVGAVVVISIPFNRTIWGWKLFAGTLAIIIGLGMRARPLDSAYILSALVVWCLGIGTILTGAALIIQGVAYAGWGRTIPGILSLAFGVVLIFTAVIGALVVPSMFGIAGVVGGILVIVNAFRTRARSQRAGLPDVTV